MKSIKSILETLVKVIVGIIRLPFSVLAIVSTSMEKILAYTERYLIREVNNLKMPDTFDQGAHLKTNNVETREREVFDL